MGPAAQETDDEDLPDLPRLRAREVVKRSERKARPGPDGLLIVPPGYKLGGEPKGGARKRTKKQTKALAAGRHRTGRERALVREYGRDDAPKIIEAYDAAGTGDFGPLSKLSLRRHARGSMLYDAAVEAVEKDGLVLLEEATTGDGVVIGSRRKIHPAADFALKAASTFGLDSEALLTSPKARNVSKRDDAITAHLERQREWRESAAENAAITDGAIDSEVVEDVPEPEKEGDDE